MTLLLVSPKSFPGVVAALRNLSAVIGAADFKYLEDVVYRKPRFKSGSVQRGYSKIQKNLRLLDLHTFAEYGENIVLGGWSGLHEFLIQRLNKAGIRPSLMWCSTLGQAEMTRTEIYSLLKVLEYLKERKIRYLLLHKRLEVLKDLFGYLGDLGCAVDLPHTINLERVIRSESSELEGRNADLFLPLRFGKNVVTQLAAAKLSRSVFTLHSNVDVDWFRKISSEMGLKMFFHPWLKEKEYWRLLSGMDISLQVTHTESFNYAVCERMCLGLPVLATQNIWLLSEDDLLKKYLCVEAPDTPRAIAEKIDAILDDEALRKDLGARCRERIEAVAEKSNRIAREKIEEIFG
jgi:glycosyltransferase involved in cell wall biosynthesis